MRIVIVGAGFAGMYAALSAARLRDIQGVAPEMLEIVLVSPEPTLVVRPRLYEANPETLTAPLLDVLRAIDVVYLQGSVETVDTKVRAVKITTAGRAEQIIAYDRLILATGSRLFRPDIPGLAQYGFSVDQLGDAIALDRHLHDLAKQPSSKMRDTVVVAGGGFTGIEAATEMPARLRATFGKNANPRVVIVERNDVIASDMGAGPRPIIADALHELGVETRLGVGVASLEKSGVSLTNGEHIETATVIWAAGMRAAPPTTVTGIRSPFTTSSIFKWFKLTPAKATSPSNSTHEELPRSARAWFRVRVLRTSARSFERRVMETEDSPTRS